MSRIALEAIPVPLRLTFGDLLVVLAALTVSLGYLVSLVSAAEPSRAVITAEGVSVGPYDLRRQRLVRVAGPLGDTEIEIRAGRARIRASLCPHQVCVRRGWLSRSGQVAVCVPNLVILEIVGEKSQTQLDAISR